MQALIDFIIRNLLALWPIARVRDWECGMIIRGGKIHHTLGPGLHWRWWFVDEVKIWAANVTAVDLATGAVQCGALSYSVSGNMTYRVTDLPQFWMAYWNSEYTLRLIATGIMCDVVAEYDATTPRETLSLEITKRLRAEAEGKGMEIVSFRLTDLVQVDGRRHFVEGTLSR